MSIHATALVAASAQLGKDVEIGPYTIIHDNVVLGDGSTHFIKDTIRLETFQSLTTVNGGEVVSIKDDG